MTAFDRLMDRYPYLLEEAQDPPAREPLPKVRPGHKPQAELETATLQRRLPALRRGHR
jgi:hypothetical protein